MSEQGGRKEGGLVGKTACLPQDHDQRHGANGRKDANTIVFHIELCRDFAPGLGRAMRAFIEGQTRRRINVNAATNNREEPGDSQQHDGGASQGTHTDGQFFLGILAQATKQHDGSVGHGSQDGQDDRAHDAREGRNEQKQLRTLADHVAGVHENLAVHRQEK